MIKFVLRFLAIILVCFGCDSNKEEVIFYRVLSSEKKITAYYKVKSYYHSQGKREDSVVRFDKEGRIQDVYQQINVLEKNSLSVVKSFADPSTIRAYKASSLNPCTEYGKHLPLVTLICYEGNHDYKGQNAFFFKETQLATDGVEKRKVFDNNFFLLEEEYLTGYLDYYKIEKINFIPEVLK